MLADDWKNWKTCTDDNLYVRLGLDPKKADSYTASQIETAYKERMDWWAKRPRSNPSWAERIQLAESALSEANSTLTDEQKRREYDQKLKKEGPKKLKIKQGAEIKRFVRHSIYPAIQKGKLLTANERKNILYRAQTIGLSKEEGESLILETAKKYNIPEDKARKAIDECLKEDVLKLHLEMVGKSYYEILGVSKKASAKEIEEAYKKQFNLWNSRAADPKFRDLVPPVKDMLIEAQDTLKDPHKKEEYDRQFKVSFLSIYRTIIAFTVVGAIIGTMGGYATEISSYSDFAIFENPSGLINILKMTVVGGLPVATMCAFIAYTLFWREA